MRDRKKAPVHRDVNVVVTESLDRVEDILILVLDLELDSTVFSAVYEAVDNAKHWAVTEAVNDVENEDSEHPDLQDFLREARL